ncbi:hypothetical protein ACLI08_01980 [Flavobacterium sp. RNTU_13]|uniref:hypothetical protein n=1 Tax=Flavobacterium sp. RNTU_13 TaxID=3375145 RepID=UPI0039882250
MKLVVMFIAFIVAGLPVGDLATIRKEYVNAAVSEQSTNNFYKRFEDVTDTHQNTTLVAYKAVSIVLKARYESGLFSKKRLFDKGTSLLDATIKKDYDNYEARLIRLNIQDNVPWITGYTGQIKADKKFLLKNFDAQPADLKAFAKAYILQSEVFSAKEKKLVE